MTRQPLLAGVCALALLAAGATGARAQTTYIWTGASSANSNWSDGTNWNPGLPASDPANTVIQMAGTTRLTNILDLAPGSFFDINSLTFASGAGAFVINPSATPTTLRINTGGITSNATTTQTIAAPLALSAQQTWATTTTGALTVSGAVNLNANLLSLGGTGTGAINISGVISGTGGVVRVGNATQVTTLSNAANTYTGPTTISSGILATATLANGGTASGIGASSNAAGNLVLDGGTFRYTGAAVTTDRLFTLTQNGGTLQANGSAALTFGNAGAIAFSGTGARTLTLDGTSTAANTITPVIGDDPSGATSIVKNGAGRWVLAGANTYTGTTTINAGSLQFNSAAAIPPTAPAIVVNAAGSAAAGYAIDQAFLGRIDPTSTGAAALAVNSANALDFTSLPSLRLGAAAGTTATYTGTLTPNGTTYRFGSPAGGNLVLPNVLPDVVSGTTNVESGFNGLTGTVSLNGANTYTGTVTVGGGALATTNLTNGGLPSGLGQSSNAASNVVLNGGTLRFTGGAAGAPVSTDRLFTIGTGTSGIDNSGAGALAVAGNTAGGANAIAFNGGGARTFNLTGSTGTVNTFQAAGYTIPLTAAFNTFAPAIANEPGGGVTSVLKNGTGLWMITSPNTYTGPTTISAGTLAVSRPAAGATPFGTGTITLSGGTVSFRGPVANPLTITAGSFTQDVIASVADFHSPNPFGTSASVDNVPGTASGQNQYALFQNNPTDLATVGLPTYLGLPNGRQFVSVANPLTTYQLRPYDNGAGGGFSNNALYLSGDTTNTGSLNIAAASQGSYQTVSVLLMGGGGATPFNATLHFTDGSTTPYNGLTAPDWFNNTPFAITDLGRFDRFDGNFDTATGNPRMYPIDLNLSAADQAKTLDRIDFTRLSGGRLNIFGASAAAPGGPTSYANPVTVTANSTLEMLNTGSLALGPLTIGSNTLSTSTGSTTPFTLSFAGTTLTGSPTFNVTTGLTVFPGAITFSGATARTVTKSGGGILVLDSPAANTSAINTLSTTAGTTNVTNITALGTTPNVTTSGGTANLGPYAAVNNVTTSGGTANLPNVTAAATATISGGTTNFTLAPTIPTTTTTGGTVNFNAGATLGTVTMNGGAINIGGATTAAQLSGGGVVGLGANNLTIGSNNASVTFGGAFTGTGGSVTKVGTGTQTLSSPSSTFTGGTNVTAGRVTATVPGSLGAGTVTLQNGTTLGIGGTPGPTLSGFGGNGTGWSRVGVTAPAITNNVMTVTPNTGNQANAAWFATPFNLANFGTGNGAFTASFRYSDVNANNGGADGTTFTIQSVSNTAVGGGGGALGYNGISPSLAMEINIYVPNTPGIYVHTNGATGGATNAPPYDTTGSITTWNSGVGNEILVNLSYDGANAYTVTLTQGSNAFTKTYNPYASGNLTSNIGNPANIFVGFTGGTGGAQAQQNISNFAFNWTGDTTPRPPLSTYANAVTLPDGAAATITPLVATGVTTFTMGNLSMGSGSALTIAADAGSLANTAYNLTLGATTLAGPATFNVVNNGTGTGQLTLGGLNDGGTARTITAAGPGTLVLAGAATSLVNGTQVNVTGGTLSLNNATALGSLAAVDLAASTNMVVGTSTTLGALTGTGNVALNGTTLTVGSTNNLSSTFGGVIANGTSAGALVKGGTGTFTLTGANTYSGAGGTTISAGTLQLGAGGTTGSILGNVTDNGALVFNRSDAVTFAGTINGTGTLTQAGTSTLILTGNNGYSGGTTISAGTLQVGSGGTSGAIGSGNVANATALVFNRSDTYAFPGVISGAGSVTQAGTGTTTLAGNSTYTGGTVISAGTLQLGAGGTTGSITGSVVDNGTLAFNRSDVVTFAGDIFQTGAVAQVGTGTTVLTGNNSYSGGTTISAGTLQIGAGGTAGSITGNVTNNGTLAFNRSDGVTFTGVISGTGSVVQNGPGALTPTGANAYSGGTTVNAGALNVNSGGTASSSPIGTGTLTMAGGAIDNTSGSPVTLATNNAQAWTGDFAFGGTRALNLGTGAVTLGGAGTSRTVTTNGTAPLTVGGAIGGALGLTKAGPGTLILTGASTYTGPTAVTGGTLLAHGTLGTATQPITVGTGGTLGGNGTLTASSTTFQAGSTLSPGASVGTLTLASPVTITGGSGSTWIVEFNGAGSSFPPPVNTPNDRLAVTGSGNNLNIAADPSNKLTISVRAIDGFGPVWGTPMSYTIATTDPSGAIQSNGSPFAFDPNAYTFQPVGFDANNFSLGTSGNQLVLTFTPVPEPGVVLAVSAGAFGLLTWTRRRPRRARTDAGATVAV